MKEFVIKKDEIFSDFTQEWLVTNGISGFGCGTIAGVPTRKYHSLLNASLAAPFGRTVMLNHVLDEVVDEQKGFPLSSFHFQGQERPKVEALVEFRLENGIPTWRYEKNGVILEKSLFLIHQQNTLCIFYELFSAEEVLIKWRPYFHFRNYEQGVSTHQENEQYNVRASEKRIEIDCAPFPTLRILDKAEATFVIDFSELKNIFYEIESLRGYESVGNLKSPGFFTFTLKPRQRAAFMISTEEWMTLEALSPEKALSVENFRKKNLLKSAGIKDGGSIKAKLVLAADQFLITPNTRHLDMIRLHAAGEEVRSIIAGFPWFTDWGRDTMISLEGLTLCTGRHREASAILHTFSFYIKEGLIPNMFPDGLSQGIYNTADASLWFFHAIERYIQVTGDTGIIEFLLSDLKEIIEHHLKGTSFGIGVDEDGLLIQGSEGYALTWMDAKMGDWIVTPRRGKAVEINALWYNALRLFEKWTNSSLPITNRCYESFNEKFWYASGNYLYDLIEGEELEKDPSLRPNQLFAISLDYPVLQKERWESVLQIVEKELLTPFGLRTLAPSNPQYKAYYHGNLQARDSAYHQGTVWPWLMGPFVDVWLKVHPDQPEFIKPYIKSLEEQLHSTCLGTLGEIYDAADPHHARGCFAQAWSVAELLRILCKIS